MGLFQERENQMTATSREDIILYIVGGLIGVLGLLTGAAMLVNRIACGAWAAPSGVFDVFSFFGTGDASVFGQTTEGCAAPGGAIVTVWVITLILVVSGAIVGVIKYREYLESDGYFVKRLRERRGVAKRREVNKAMGHKAAVKVVGKVRPTLKEKPLPEKANIEFGYSEGIQSWIALEESIVFIGPPRSGKGVNILVKAIIDAPGPVITTSSRADNYAMTAAIRAKRGPVTLFDPQGLTGKPTTLKWSPITGCETARVANQRATSLVSAAGLSEDSSNSEWRPPAIGIMQALLHACALAGEGVDTLMKWGTSPAEAKDAVKILREHEEAGRAARGWATSLESEIESDPKMRTNKWFGVANAVGGLSVDNVRDVMNPKTKDEEFNIDEFIQKSGTLYIVGTKTGGSSAGPFLVAMMDAITERAREIAAKSEGNRLDPPMMLVLDEIANITKAWEGLVPLMADGGGVGICVMAVFQSMAQVRNSWGEQAASAIFDAATVKIQLGGASNTQDLEVLSTLAGQREVVRSSKTRQKDGSSVSDQLHEKKVFEVSELHRLPFGWAVVFFRNNRPMLMKLTPYWKSKYAEEINMTKKLYAQSLLDEGEEDSWEKHLGSMEDGEIVASEVVDTDEATGEVRQEPEAKTDDEQPSNEDSADKPSITMF
ncbi:TraM recognition site of TraD and TraG [Brevibacterium iodinum ATCC 49514]|uniref:TraM recognition site of TraD and TraG n=1 Tax=Brevibacterium iodinum ATCC 49514 TaxID=1255616 RepID=A0A2H1JV62_9MICO|nr:TraM recognition domain-containing protein [Brevibacterium iodinum]SMX91349.1 TraM recognition site of TraD and TraG [Brevibacterium iodinum ATCC 49514]SUW70175.1 conjugal transfer coupling protein TraG [Brevibacterium iodinum]